MKKLLSSLVVLTAFLLTLAAGVNGTWFLFLASETLTMLGILGYVWVKKRHITWRPEDVLLFRADFGVPPEDLLEVNPTSLEEIITVSREAYDFCKRVGGSDRLAGHLSLCI